MEVGLLGRRAAKKGPSRSVQDWLPVRDLEGGLVMRADGVQVAVIRVEPAPFALLSDRERERRIGALHEAIQSLPGSAQILVTSRPIALDGYLAELADALGDARDQRRGLLRGYLGYVREVLAVARRRNGNSTCWSRAIPGLPNVRPRNFGRGPRSLWRASRGRK